MEESSAVCSRIHVELTNGFHNQLKDGIMFKVASIGCTDSKRYSKEIGRGKILSS